MIKINSTITKPVILDIPAPPPPFTNDFSMQFDGVDEHVAVPDNNLYSFGDGTTDSPFSLSVWINVVDGTRFCAISKYSAGAREYYIGLNTQDSLEAVLYDHSTGGFIRGSFNVAIITNISGWHQIAMTYDGSMIAAGIKVYIDGIHRTVLNNSSGSYTAMENGGEPLNIGRLDAGVWQANGKIDEPAIWSKELTAAEITENYNLGVPNNLLNHSASANLVGTWGMGDDSVFTGGNWEINDRTANANTATSVNMEEADRVADVPA